VNPHDSLHRPHGDRPHGFELRPRLLVAFIGMGAVIILASLFAALTIRSVDESAGRLVRDLSKQTAMMARLRQEFLLVRVAEKNLIIEDSQEGMDVFEQRIVQSEESIASVLTELASPGNPAVAARVQEFSEQFARFRSSLRSMIELCRRNTLAEAAERSRGKGRGYFQTARAALMSFLERNRAVIARAAGTPEGVAQIEPRTAMIAAARDALEGMHDLQYLEQAILTVFSSPERQALSGRIESLQGEVRAAIQAFRQARDPDDLSDIAAFERAFDAWTANSADVQRLAQEDSKARAMALSTSAVRDAYLRASEVLDGLMQENDRAAQAMLAAHEQTLATGRTLILAVAAAGILVVGLTAWIVVGVVLREYRDAAEMLTHG
jgi:hypothetical protein